MSRLHHAADGSEGLGELLAGRALGDLSLEEAGMLRESEGDEAAIEFEAALGSTYLAFAGSLSGSEFEGRAGVGSPGSPERVPDQVVHRLHRLADAFVASWEAAPSGASRMSLDRRDRPPVSVARRSVRLSWAVAAASLLLGGLGWVVAMRPVGSPAPGGPVPGQVLRQVAARPDAVTIPWADWSDGTVAPEVTGVTGEVVWSDQAQTGVMRLAGLPHLPGSVYQLWIIDAERGMSQRVSGAIFTAGDKETWVTIEPRLRIAKAAAFAVTIEQPGGTWVSDMSRRVVIAPRPG